MFISFLSKNPIQQYKTIAKGTGKPKVKLKFGIWENKNVFPIWTICRVLRKRKIYNIKINIFIIRENFLRNQPKVSGDTSWIIAKKIQNGFPTVTISISTSKILLSIPLIMFEINPNIINNKIIKNILDIFFFKQEQKKRKNQN